MADRDRVDVSAIFAEEVTAEERRKALEEQAERRRVADAAARAELAAKRAQDDAPGWARLGQWGGRHRKDK